MRLEPIKNQISSEVRKVDNARKASNEHKTHSSSHKTDSSSFSSDAQKLNETQTSTDIVSTQLSMESDIRIDKIEEVRKKISHGYYSTDEFLEKLTDKLIDDLGLGNQK